ncbi:galactonate dehydratase [Streptomyces sp. NPDC001288]|uniref:galactonate dehydratase n=1 Tax=unclassified Streptomyces TaxID=2593676 RepID=UPI003322F5B8
MPEITEITPFCLPPRWILVRVRTDDGAEGWGEAIVPKRRDAVRGALADLSRTLIGTDPNRIEEAILRCRRGAFFRGGPVLSTAAAAIEHALWDRKARTLGTPVYELLGGRVRERVKVYAWIGGDRPDDVVAAAQARLDQGFSVVKMNATSEFDLIETTAAVDTVVARVAALRDTFGTRLDIALDFHGRVARPMVRPLLRELEQYRLLWVEEPVPPGHDELLPQIRGSAGPTRIATGERLASRWEFRTLLTGGAVDVLQPDVSLTGLFEMEKICRMAECFDIPVVPHCPNGPVSLAASLQVAGCAANIPLLEQSLGIHYNAPSAAGGRPTEVTDYLLNPQVLLPHEGYLKLPDQPGLGIDLDVEEITRRQTENLPADADWRLPDGRVTEW